METAISSTLVDGVYQLYPQGATHLDSIQITCGDFASEIHPAKCPAADWSEDIKVADAHVAGAGLSSTISCLHMGMLLSENVAVTCRDSVTRNHKVMDCQAPLL